MNKKRNLYCINYSLCDYLLLKLQILELKCDQVLTDLSETSQLIESLHPDVNTLIDSIKRSAKDLYNQSLVHRKYVGQCMSGKPCMYLTKRIGNGY